MILSTDYNCIDAKVVVLGGTGVGKTSIVVRYVSSGYNKHASPTIGASFFTAKLTIDTYRLNLQVWDTAGQERFRSMTPMYYRKANAALLVYDMTSRESYDAMQSWVLEIQKNVENKIVMCVIGNKSDLATDRAITVEEAQDYAASINAFHFETSAVTNDGIDKVFLHVAKSLIFMFECDTDSEETPTGDHKTITLPRTGENKPDQRKSKCCSS